MWIVALIIIWLTLSGGSADAFECAGVKWRPSIAIDPELMRRADERQAAINEVRTRIGEQAGPASPTPSLTGEVVTGNPVQEMFEWQTSDKGTLLCHTPFALKEALTAVKALDARWLNETGCFFSKGGLKVILMDTLRVRDRDLSRSGTGGCTELMDRVSMFTSSIP